MYIAHTYKYIVCMHEWLYKSVQLINNVAISLDGKLVDPLNN